MTKSIKNVNIIGMAEAYVPPAMLETMSASRGARIFSSFIWLLSITLTALFAASILDDYVHADGQRAKEALPYFALFAVFALMATMMAEGKRADIAAEERCRKYRSYP